MALSLLSKIQYKHTKTDLYKAIAPTYNHRGTASFNPNARSVQIESILNADVNKVTCDLPIRVHMYIQQNFR